MFVPLVSSLFALCIFSFCFASNSSLCLTVCCYVQVYHQFDLDCNDSVGKQELFKLGQVKRHMGKQQAWMGEWTMENTITIMDKIGADTQGSYSLIDANDAALLALFTHLIVLENDGSC